MDCVYETENSYILIFEAFNTESLKKYVKTNGPLNQRKALLVLQTLFDVLKYLHNKGIMHRDINPDCICFKDSDSKINQSNILLGNCKN